MPKRNATTSRNTGRHLLVPGVVLLIGLLATTAVTVQLWRLTNSKDRMRFEENVERRQARIQERIHVYVAMLRSLSGLLAAEPDLTLADFQRYVGRINLEENYPDVQGLGFSRRIEPEDLEALVENLRQQGHESFAIRPATPRNEYHLIVYLEPLDARNAAAIGYDMFTNPTRRAAMERARDTGSAAVSGQVTLVQEIDEDVQPGFLIYVPVYEGGGIPETVAERRERLVGFAYSPFRARDLFSGIFGRESRSGVAVEIYDGETASAANLLYRSPGLSASGWEGADFSTTSRLEVAGRPWTVRFATLPAFGRASGQGLVPLTGIGGVMLSLLFAAVTWQQVRARSEAERHRAAAQRLAAIVEGSEDAIVSKRIDGTITSWNDGAERLFGYSAREMIGQNVRRLFPPSRVAEEEDLIAHIAQGERVPPFWSKRLTKDGRLIDVSISVSPIRDWAGRVVGASKVARDVSDRIRIDEALRAAEQLAREEGQTLAILNRLGTSLASKLDLHELVQTATNDATKLTGARFGAFFYNVISEKGRSYTLYSISGVPREHFEKFPMPRATAIFEPTFSGSGVIRLDDVTADPRYGKSGPHFGMPEGYLPVRSYLAVPVVSRSGEVLGGLFFGHPEPGVFTERAERLAIGIAAQAAIGIDNARLFETVARTERRLQLAVDIAEIGAFEIDLETDEVTVNDRGRAIYGWADDAALTFRQVQSHFHPGDREEVMRQVEAAFAPEGSGEFEVEQRILRTDGAERWIRVRGRAIFAGEGNVRRATRCVGTYLDITEHHEAAELRERTLAAERAAREEAERLGRLKDEFLSTLSHELRTPLNAILGWAALLDTDHVDPAELREGLAVIDRSARAQAQLIEDLLDVSRIISGKLRLDVQDVDLPAVLDAAIATVQPAADAKGIRVQRVIDPMAGPVSGDPGRLQQVFWNLLSNAVKFTPKGGRVQVRLARVNSHVEVAVTDNGQGIGPEFLPHLFERFRQADASTTRNHGGLGLGLSIVKQLVELHGGNVHAASPGVGEGATFVVELPLIALHAPAAWRERSGGREHPRATTGGGVDCEPESLAGVRVLVIDDDADARNLVRRVLMGCGAEIALAASVAEALQAIELEVPDLVVGDIGMPGRDGYDFIREVRSRGHSASDLPAVALTAFARSEDRARVLRAGYQIHLAKPVDPSELVAVVASLAGRDDGKPARSGSP